MAHPTTADFSSGAFPVGDLEGGVKREASRSSSTSGMLQPAGDSGADPPMIRVLQPDGQAENGSPPARHVSLGDTSSASSDFSMSTGSGLVSSANVRSSEANKSPTKHSTGSGPRICQRHQADIVWQWIDNKLILDVRVRTPCSSGRLASAHRCQSASALCSNSGGPRALSAGDSPSRYHSAMTSDPKQKSTAETQPPVTRVATGEGLRTGSPPSFDGEHLDGLTPDVLKLREEVVAALRQWVIPEDLLLSAWQAEQQARMGVPPHQGDIENLQTDLRHRLPSSTKKMYRKFHKELRHARRRTEKSQSGTPSRTIAERSSSNDTTQRSAMSSGGKSGSMASTEKKSSLDTLPECNKSSLRSSHSSWRAKIKSALGTRRADRHQKQGIPVQNNREETRPR